MATLGSLPTNINDMKNHPDYRQPFYAAYMESLSVCRAEPLLPEITLRQQVLNEHVAPVLNGKAPFAGMLEQLQERIETILRESRK